MKPPLLSSLLPQEIADALDLEPYRGRQIFRWIHQKGVQDLADMSDLPKELRQRAAHQVRIEPLETVQLAESQRSAGTRKAVFRLADGETVESVLIRDRDRATLCLSSQVGCAVKCSFCATGLSGYKRNLAPGEIAAQASAMLAGVDLDGRKPNIVYMGMGEPFRNYGAVMKSAELLMDPNGLNIGQRRITISTVGEVNGVRRFAHEPWQVRLSVSLHAANDALRSVLVPLNRKYPLAELRESIEYYILASGRQITFEWTLLEGVNDLPEHAKELAEFMDGLKATVNLIPYNPVEELDYKAPSRKRCEAFRDMLARKGVTATLRRERGQDISAACGQLRRQTA